MKVKDILSIKLEEDIKSVIDLNSQSENDIKEELDGFILTESLATHLSDFCAIYHSGTRQSGIWLSGFYGSGKSYFAKMVGFLLANPTIVGTPMRERFLNKLGGLKNAALLKDQISSLDKTENHVVLFDSAKYTGNYGICYMMMGSFLRSLSLLDNWMGLVEYDFWLDNKYDDFLHQVESVTGKKWCDVKNNIALAYKTFKQTLLGWNYSEDEFNEVKKMAEMRIKDYDAIKLAEDLSKYIAKFPEKRIVFMVDEVSEAITQKKINILDIEGLSEALADKAQKIWTIAIAQQKLDDVVTASGISISLLTKLIDRFKNRINISAEEVDTIIRQRLLAKNSIGNEKLESYYNQNSGMIRDITNMGAVGLKMTESAKTYADYYPFFEHQFKMLQYFLFGTQKLVKTQIGTRGMLLSIFDVLKKEAMNEAELFSNVNANQLCKQAEENVAEGIRNRFEQADACLSDQGFIYITGKSLLRTIYFLSGAEVINLTAENITKAIVNKADDYYAIKAEVNKALTMLVEARVLMLSNNQYRITSQVAERIMSEMLKDKPQPFVIIGETTKALKSSKFLKSIQSLNIDGININFSLTSDNGEPLSNLGDEKLKVVFYSPFSVQSTLNDCVNQVKTDTQSNKNIISIIPSPEHLNQLDQLMTMIKQIDVVSDKNYSLPEEKTVINELLATKEESLKQFTQLVHQAYMNGMMVYCYNNYQLTEDNFTSEVQQVERRMFDNIYTRRLSATLSDSLASKVMNISLSAVQLKNLFTSPEFQFFDSTGNFIGDSLSVVAEIMPLAKSYISGTELENKLSGPPTGYSYGVIVTTMAALFRGNKVIVKFAGNDYHSFKDKGAADIFSNSKNFGKASFKAVSKNLTYQDRQEIVDILKEDCHYKKWTQENLTYSMNDFELVDAIRTLSKSVLKTTSDKIMGDDELERLFKGSVKARDVFSQYTGTVTDMNFYSTAKTFLQEEETHEFIAAIERIEKDLKFIEDNFAEIEKEKQYLNDIEEELNKTNSDKSVFNIHKEQFELMRTSDMVANFTKMKTTVQDVKDLYFQLMKHQAELMTDLYIELSSKAEQLQSELDQYPKEWNQALYDQISNLQDMCKKHCGYTVKLDINYSIKCKMSNLSLRDMLYICDQADKHRQQLQLWGTEVVTTAPVVVDTKPQTATATENTEIKTTVTAKPQPKERKMKSQLPTGKLNVAQYRKWLKDQLSLTNHLTDNDIVNFDE